ncbi:unnamed protein product [Hymenolepis diminuta]|uniref:Uncharacterized protein n=1 Tax=Hymenolepis diminuta TaxID=6216 RepID=A0A564YLH6_HYMDI|nr:unnamed protein product [Hymenolepis diminuta]
MQMLIPPSLSARNLLDKLLRIDHAKGLAAKYMYKGQLAVLNNGSVVDTLRNSLSEEKARPSALMPVWKVAGFAFGITTALLGEEAIKTFNSAVETVVAEQYNHQIRELFADNPAAHAELLDLLKQFRDKDLETHDLIKGSDSNLGPFYRQLSQFAKMCTMAGIKIAEVV